MKGAAPALAADALSRIMLMQGMLSHLPSEEAIFGFVARGLQDLPGVRRARHQGAGALESVDGAETFPVELSQRSYGAFVVEVGQAEAFAPYAGHVHNLCFMIAVILEERRQRGLNAEHEQELERKVEERTQQLLEEVSIRRAAEQDALAEKERLIVTLRSIADGVITTDTEGNIVLMNAVAERLTGWTQAEAAGQPLARCYPLRGDGVHDPRSSLPRRAGAGEDRVELQGQAILTARNGEEHLIAHGEAPIRTGQGASLGVVLVFRDVAEQRRMLEIMQRADRLDALGILAGGIAHDFNNLLGGVFGHVELARLDATDPGVISELDQALAAIDRARGLAGQLLTFAKGGAPVKSVGSLVPLLRAATEFALSGTRASCRCDLPADLWPCEFDAVQLGQVIDNILINAVQAMPSGGVIDVSASNATLGEGEKPSLPAGRYVRFAVKDTGVGIPAGVLQRIFDPFFTTKPRGNGLGLATCYSIVSRHDGSIEVESEPGRGTCFTVLLPACPDATASTGAARARRHRGEGTILVMDDEPTILRITERLLASLGYTALTAEHGDAALVLFDRERSAGRAIAAAILDLTVRGGLGGLEVAAALRERTRELPIFVVSGYAKDPVMSDPAHHGFTDSLCKPFTRGELEGMLARHLRRDAGERRH